MNISIYEPNGFITAVITADPQTIELNKQTHDLWIDGAWDKNTHYIKNNQALERPACPATLDGLTLRNLPTPCKIVINDKEYDVTDKTVTLEFDYPGKYLIKVIAFPYLYGEFEIET